MTRQAPDARYVAPERWQHEAPLSEGSGWPAWEAWLAGHAGELVPARQHGDGIEPAPGHYVLAP